MSELDSYPIHRVVHRANLFLDADRTLMISLGALCGVIAVFSGHLLTSALAIGVWLACAPLLRYMAKADPLMRQVYYRYYSLKSFYAARSTPFCHEVRCCHERKTHA